MTAVLSRVTSLAGSWRRLLKRYRVGYVLPHLPAVPPALADEPAAKDRIEQIEAALLKMPQVEMPLTHRFAPHVYWREIFMPKGTVVIGHRHKTEHFNVILTGRASVIMDGVMQEVRAGDVLVSKPGVRKILYIHEDMRWATVHPTDETNIEKLEEQHIIKSEAWHDHQKTLGDLDKLKGAIACPMPPLE